MPYDDLVKKMGYTPKVMDEFMTRTFGNPTEQINPIEVTGNLMEEADSVTGKPVRAAALAAIEGRNPLSEAKQYFGAGPEKEVSGKDVAHSFLKRTEESSGVPLKAPGMEQYPSETPVGLAVDFASQVPAFEAAKSASVLGKSAIKAAPSIVGNEIGSVGANIKPNNLGLYSKLEDVLTQKMGKSASAQDVEKMVANAGVKPEEIQYSKLKEFLTGKDKVGKEELLEHVRSNTPQIEERVLESPKSPKLESIDTSGWQARQDSNTGLWSVDNEKGQFLDSYIKAGTKEEAIEIAKKGELNRLTEISPRQHNPTKFGDYTTPGGDNYREVLMKLPENPEFNALAKKRIKLEEELKNAKDDKEGLRILKELSELSKAESTASFNTPDTYKSAHWDDPNVLAHYRLKDFPDMEGKKTLLAEEVQSDWHQAGRERGYISPNSPSESPNSPSNQYYKFKEDLIKKYFGQNGIENGYGFDELKPKMSADENIEMDRLFNNLTLNTDAGEIPDAPFKKTWHELVMKRLLNRAANEGYDKLAWVPGEQQAARYDLSKQIGSIDYNRNPDGTFKVGVDDIGGHESLYSTEAATPEELEKVLGKEITQKIVNGEGKAGGGRNTLYGEDLKMGGEGMKGFYDKMLVDYMNKFAKKYGQQVEKTALELPNGSTPVHSLKLTPEMIEAIKAGLPLFALGGLAINPDQIEEEANKYETLRKLLSPKN